MSKQTLFTTGTIIFGFMFLVATLNATFQAGYKSIQEAHQVVTLTGTVLDADRKVPIPNAKVKVNETQDSTKTNDTGIFTLNGMETGAYTLEVEAEGYEIEETEVELTGDEDNLVEIELTANY